ncbi:MAG: UbiA family prenyltransferase [Chitinophagaceae bacterium]|nr:UbiA family prenyltransferase [Oligoflexus sp.]
MTVLFKNWLIFIRERFPLGSHIPMVVLFTLGNITVTQHIMGVPEFPPQAGLIALLAFMFFFRLRLFDEIKDYEVDLKVNPTRPLARGVLTVNQVKVMITAISVLEVLTASNAGQDALILHGCAMLYSFFMYREFFIGSFLRQHLTTYAVTHTFVSTLLGLSIAAQTVGLVNPSLLQNLLWMAPINWAMFNLFEFARKSFAPTEEREHVESYSSLFGVWGALALSWSQVAIALVFLWSLRLGGFEYQVLGALIPFVAGLFYAVKKDARFAVIFRKSTGLYLLLFYSGLYLQYHYART